MDSCVWNLKEIIEEDGDDRNGVIEEEGDGNVYVLKSPFYFLLFFLMKVEFVFGGKENRVFFFNIG